MLNVITSSNIGCTIGCKNSPTLIVVGMLLGANKMLLTGFRNIGPSLQQSGIWTCSIPASILF